MDQNSQDIVAINNSKTAKPNINAIFSSFDNLLFDAYIIFSKLFYNTC